jgi:hypothetical protein
VILFPAGRFFGGRVVCAQLQIVCDCALPLTGKAYKNFQTGGCKLPPPIIHFEASDGLRLNLPKPSAIILGKALGVASVLVHFH